MPILLAGFGVGRHATVSWTQHCLSGELLEKDVAVVCR